MPRNPIEVAKELLKVIPHPENKKLMEIAKIELSPYAAPEHLHPLWDDIAHEVNWLCKAPEPLTEEWQVKAVSILTTLPEEEVRAKFFKKEPL